MNPFHQREGVGELIVSEYSSFFRSISTPIHIDDRSDHPHGPDQVPAPFSRQAVDNHWPVDGGCLPTGRFTRAGGRWPPMRLAP